MDQTTTPTERRKYFEAVLPELLEERALFADIVDGITKGNPYPNLKRTEVFDNEMLLYLDGGRRFSLRMCVYAPGEYSRVHDHNAWGVTGCVNGHLGVMHYNRLDDEVQPGVAILRRSGNRTLVPGETEYTQPLEHGIHATGAEGSEPVLMVSVFGTPVRRLHVNIFDPERNTVTEAYPPRIHKRMLANAVRPYLKRPSSPK